MAGTRKIPLTKGAVALVDEDDYDRLVSMGSWHLSSGGYAVRRNKKEGTIRMHRVINNTPEGLFTDHLNHNRLDNRKSNLRSVTQKQNMNNYKGAKGITWDKEKNRWMVRYKKKFYGRYSSVEEAERAYQKAKSGVPKEEKTHARRKYLQKGIMFMKPQAERNNKPYYIRPQINGERMFYGYFSTPADAEIALSIIQDAGRRIVS